MLPPSGLLALVAASAAVAAADYSAPAGTALQSGPDQKEQATVDVTNPWQVKVAKLVEDGSHIIRGEYKTGPDLGGVVMADLADVRYDKDANDDKLRPVVFADVPTTGLKNGRKYPVLYVPTLCQLLQADRQAEMPHVVLGLLADGINAGALSANRLASDAGGEDELSGYVGFDNVAAADKYVKNFVNTFPPPSKHGQRSAFKCGDTHYKASDLMSILDSDNLIGLFTIQQTPVAHKKLHSVPIGVATNLFEPDAAEAEDKFSLGKQKPALQRLLEAGRKVKAASVDAVAQGSIYAANSDLPPRCIQQHQLRLAGHADFVNHYECSDSVKGMDKSDYLISIAVTAHQNGFVFSPPGLGTDCFRIWESLAMGGIPVVMSSTIDKQFNNLPVIIVDDYGLATPSELAHARRNLEGKDFDMRPITGEYWVEQIEKLARGEEVELNGPARYYHIRGDAKDLSFASVRGKDVCAGESSYFSTKTCQGRVRCCDKFDPYEHGMVHSD